MTRNKWKEAIEEQLNICGLDSAECINDPKKALEFLVGYIFESGYKECENRNEWKEAVIEELMCWHIYKLEHESNPRQALHDLAVINSNVAIDLHKRDRWYRNLWNSILDIWYSSPVAYKLWKICGSKQPPF